MTSVNASSNAEAWKMLGNLKDNYGDFASLGDSNGDGTMIKSEFIAFMKDKYGDQVSDALINKMWALMDTNKKGMIDGTNLKNYNALDQTEIDTIYDNVEVLNAKVQEALENLNAPGVTDPDLLKELKGAIEEAIYTAGTGADVDKIVDYF